LIPERREENTFLARPSVVRSRPHRASGFSSFFGSLAPTALGRAATTRLTAKTERVDPGGEEKSSIWCDGCRLGPLDALGRVAPRGGGPGIRKAPQGGEAGLEQGGHPATRLGSTRVIYQSARRARDTGRPAGQQLAARADHCKADPQEGLGPCLPSQPGRQ